MKAVQAVARGYAQEILRVVDLDPPGPPAAGKVLVRVEYAPLNRHDLFAIGDYLPVPPCRGYRATKVRASSPPSVPACPMYPATA